MSNAVAVAELSNQVVTSNGILPKNFEALSEKKQKNIIIGELTEIQTIICTMAEQSNENKQEIKKLMSLLKSSKEFRRLTDLKKQNKQNEKNISISLSERNGILKIAGKMGMDIDKEVKKIKEIN